MIPDAAPPAPLQKNLTNTLTNYKHTIQQLTHYQTKDNTISKALLHHCNDVWVTRTELPKCVKYVIRQTQRAKSLTPPRS